ncbi:ornithine cyclodeaminase family protein [Halostagnicola sp. A-GB9-2]|uniref:ornithine cyclodeaminase family protein n=1 Tax=Halostagnicola sp. A-GB9-2 TaxID=3048066 RepID=UPI0024BF42F4|nr:ornithine cyclodeaminase family protein [Halostagnicola sp. A-GB9-2]MDJ1433390.1 ornithine cyclodeaminase family protein [Halostagnicola sp. A-GB9-2]
MVRILSDSDIASLLELEDVLSVVAGAFEHQREGAVERPERPHYPIGTGIDTDTPGEPTGTGLCMPAYIHGSPYAATKLVTVCPENAERELPTVNAQVSLVDVETGQPVAYLAGTKITSARTGCIGGLAARELAPDEPIDLGVIGAGTQARWQTRAIDAATELESIRVYSPSDSRKQCATDLEDELGVPAEPVSNPRDAVDGATVVVTTTTSTEPVFPGETLSPGALVIAVGAYSPEMRELDDETIARADRIFADVPEEAIETGDLSGHAELEVIEFGDVLAGDSGREEADEILVFSSVGSAVLDAATAEYVYERGVHKDVGTVVSL